eukprot:Em0015g750a
MLDLGSLSARYPVDYLEGLASLDSLDLGSLLNDSDLFGDVHRLAYCAGRAGRATPTAVLVYDQSTHTATWAANGSADGHDAERKRVGRAYLKLQAVRATLLDGANMAGLVEGRPDAPQVQRAIEAANEALKVAQCITLFSTYITNRLGVMVESATRKVCDCDRVCQEQMIVERQQVRAILRGNHAAVLHAAKTWVKTTEDASTAIRMLIEGVHAA